MSSSTRDMSWIEYRQLSIRDKIRSSRRSPPGISSVARGMSPYAQTPQMYAKAGLTKRAS